jgi:hypothetical protein
MNTLSLKMISAAILSAAMLTIGIHTQAGLASATTQPSTLIMTHALRITATLPTLPKAGDNALDIMVKNAAGKPITAAKVTTEVAMTSMDMGTDYPSVKEVGKGHYATTVSFSMAGPWRVTVKVVAVGQKPQTKSFDFTAN